MCAYNWICFVTLKLDKSSVAQITRSIVRGSIHHCLCLFQLHVPRLNNNEGNKSYLNDAS